MFLQEDHQDLKVNVVLQAIELPTPGLWVGKGEQDREEKAERRSVECWVKGGSVQKGAEGGGVRQEVQRKT